MRKIIFILSVLIAVGCKEEPKQAKVNDEAIEIAKKEFIIEMEFKTNKEDEFRLMLNNIVFDEFQKKNIHILEKVVPSSNIESIYANFGEHEPENVIINFGNKEEKVIEIKLIKITYGTKSIVSNASELNKYFVLSPFLTLDEITGNLTTKRIDGKHNPVLVLKPKTLRSLKNQQ